MCTNAYKNGYICMYNVTSPLYTCTCTRTVNSNILLHKTFYYLLVGFRSSSSLAAGSPAATVDDLLLFLFLFFTFL